MFSFQVLDGFGFVEKVCCMRELSLKTVILWEVVSVYQDIFSVAILEVDLLMVFLLCDLLNYEQFYDVIL